MKVLRIYFVFLFCLWVTMVCSGQEFLTAFYINNDITNATDTVYLGYDSTASFLYDEVFQTGDLNSVPIQDNLDIRMAQVTPILLSCDNNTVLSNNSDAIAFQSKTDVIPFNCEASSTLHPKAISYMLIPNKHLPITIRWDNTEFSDSCTSRSFFTYWSPIGWFDSSCGLFECFEELILLHNNTIQLSCPAGVQFVNEFGDSLSMLTLVFDAEITSNNQNLFETEELIISPNPSSDFIYFNSLLMNGNSVIEVHNLNGDLLRRSFENKIDISGLQEGLFLFLVRNDQNSIMYSTMFVKSQ